ncbi:hypothetical protein REPUB_Repub06bG0094300 [Reevesia pubescens]
MEESEKRKERLKAMRMEAAHAEVSTNVETSAMPGCLSNPLNETLSSLAVHHDFCRTPQFDYYTDPMAAFSANKKRGKGDNQTMQESSLTTSGWPMARPSASPPGPRNFDRNLPVHQIQGQFSLDQSVYKQGPYSPRIISPSRMHQGHFDAWNGSQAAANYYNFASEGSPRGRFGTRMHPGTSPRVWNPSNASRYGPGRSPGFSSGRGRGYGYSGSTSPGVGRSDGRGQGFHGRSPASNRTLGPECFFDDSMLEDPWQHLKPILWKRQEAGIDSLSTPGSSNSWLLKSIGIKKGSVSEASNKFNSQPSLAECLAASFNKAVEDAQNA